jgi:hypothetical protein
MVSDGYKDNRPGDVFNYAVIDLDLMATEKRLGWLNVQMPVTQMAVNEACTELLNCALIHGLNKSQQTAPRA